MFLEFERNKKIFDLPERVFYRPQDDVDMSVNFCGHKAGTPLGPAAGPHSQLAQNIVLAWLGGGRIMELKTVQILDRLDISRPCIDVRNVGHNVEWSQELRLEESLHEYVAAHMLIEILTAANLLDVDAGITSPKMRQWLETMQNAEAIVEKLRQEIPDEFAEYRNFPFKTNLSDSVTLSTFHGCPADEIESIVTFLIDEINFHVTIKMNPPMLGKERLESILHDHLGYKTFEVNQKAYETGITFAEGVDIVRSLQKVAARHNRQLGVKFSNTLEVVNNASFFSDEIMYLSGEPLHVLAMTLVQEWRKEFGTEIPISFAAGIDNHNFADAVACGLVPITTCTDLLRPGGYGRMHKYLGNLRSRMQQAEAENIDQYILLNYGNGAKSLEQVSKLAEEELQGNGSGFSSEVKTSDYLATIRSRLEESLRSNKIAGEEEYKKLVSKVVRSVQDGGEELKTLLLPLYRQWVESAALLNTDSVLEKIYDDPRYRYEKNTSTPRKIGSHLKIFDCINCDKCIPVCPNDANFSYEIEPLEKEYFLFQVADGGITQERGGMFKISDSHQIANYADFCNDCGNCDVFCPEDGGPFIEKPRFFGSADSWQRHSKLDGFFIGKQNGIVHALVRIDGKVFTFVYDPMAGSSRFSDDIIEIECDATSHEVSQKLLLDPQKTDHVLDMRYYLTTAVIVKGVLNSEEVNYVNLPLEDF
jgi:putative selenate reductase